MDYDQSFSATLRSTSLRALLAVASQEHLSLDHFDVTSAFTQAEIDTLLYVEPPKGFPNLQKNDRGDDMVLELNKALYGTKQASRLWQFALRNFFIDELKFTNSNHDPCLFSKRCKDGSVLLLGVYVDDIICAHNRKNFNWFKEAFTKKFRSKHLGKLSWFLGLAVDQHEDYSVCINQHKYISKLVERFIPNCSTSSVRHPMPCNAEVFKQLSSAKDDVEASVIRSPRNRSMQLHLTLAWNLLLFAIF